MRPKISVSITAYNEGDHIERALKSIKGWADEIIVIDCSSTDKTSSIARKYTKKVYVEPNRPNLNENKQIGIDHCTSPWVLYLDADEEVSPELKKEIDEILTKGINNNAFTMPRKNLVGKTWLKYGGWYPDRQLRLFMKGKGRFGTEGVHSFLKVNGNIGDLRNPMIHFGAYRGIHHLIVKTNNYTTNDAKLMVERGDTYPFWKMLLTSIGYAMIRIIKGAWLYGFYGILFTFNDILYRWMLYFKCKDFWKQKRMRK